METLISRNVRSRRRILATIRRPRSSWRWWCLGPLLVECSPADYNQKAAPPGLDWLEELINEFIEAVGYAIGFAMTAWIRTDSPTLTNCSDPSDKACGKPLGTVDKLNDATHWLVAALVVASVLIAAIKIAIERSGKPAGELMRGIVTLVVITTAGLATIQLLSSAGDAYSSWILDKALGGEKAEQKIAILLSAPGINLASFFILLFGLLAALVQAAINFAREGILVVLTGLLPLAGAAGLTDKGRSMRDRYLAWIGAFLCYKPAAATVWAATLWLFEDAEGISGATAALVMMAISCIALPAVMRVAVTALAGMGDTKTGGGLLGMAGHRIATGAAYMGSTGGSRKKTGTKAEASHQPAGEAPARGAAKDSGVKHPAQGKIPSSTGATPPAHTAPSHATGSSQQAAGSTTTTSAARPTPSMHPAGAAASTVASTGWAAKQHTAEATTLDHADGAADDEGTTR